jgi:tRNA(adenine34) deaminase
METLLRSANLPKTQEEGFMRRALELARQAADLKEVPVGALIVHENQIIAEAYNTRETQRDALGHAELKAIDLACKKLGRWRLEGCTLYVTLEPCVMCAGAIVQARLDKVVYGATDSKAGAVQSLYQILSDSRLNHRPQVEAGVLAQECGAILSEFFRARRSDS